MVYCKVLLVCALLASVSARPEPQLPGLNLGNLFGSLSGAAGGLFGTVDSTGQKATRLVNQGVQGIAGAGQQVVSTATNLGSSVLQGGTDVLKQGVDVLTNIAGIIPGLGGLANLGGGLLKTGVDVVNQVGQTGLGIGGGLVSAVPQVVSGLSTAGTGLVSNGIRLGTGLANAGVQTGLGVASGLFGGNGGNSASSSGGSTTHTQSVQTGYYPVTPDSSQPTARTQYYRIYKNQPGPQFVTQGVPSDAGQQVYYYNSQTSPVQQRYVTGSN